MTQFAFNSKNSSRRAHIINPITDKTYCKLENRPAFKTIDTVSEVFPADRRFCKVCHKNFKFSTGVIGRIENVRYRET